MKNNLETTGLSRLFADEFLRVGTTPVPECQVSFYPYRGLTHTIRARNGRIHVRLSDLLVDAPPEILRSVIAILISKLLQSPVPEDAELSYRRFVNRVEFRREVNRMRRRRGSKRLSSPVGRIFNLESIFRELNRDYFDDNLTVRQISWSQRRSRKTLGHFDSAHNVIVVNRRLDDAGVPEYVVAYVLYHEMLHAFLGEEVTGHGRRIHHRKFREAEKKFEYYSQAKAFLRDPYTVLSL